MACYSFPYVFVLVANALDNIPADLEDASAILGGGRWHTLRRVTLPMVLPALLAGGLIAFVQTLTQFGVPAILAMPAGFHVITTKIWALFQHPPEPHLAAAAAMPLLVATILLLQGQRLLLGRRGYTAIGGRSSAPRLVTLGAWRWPALAFALALLSLPIILPYAALIKTAIVRAPSDPLSWATLSWHNVHFVFVEFSQTRERAVEHRSARPAVGNGRYRAGARRRLCDEPAAVRRTPFSRPAGDRAGRDPRHRARGRAVLQLHAAADRALRHAVDTAAGLSDDRIAGRLSADPGGLSRPSSRAGGSEPDPRRQPAEISLGHHRAAVADRVWWRHGASCLSA